MQKQPMDGAAGHGSSDTPASGRFSATTSPAPASRATTDLRVPKPGPPHVLVIDTRRAAKTMQAWKRCMVLCEGWREGKSQACA